jgi:hypothetical protein
MDILQRSIMTNSGDLGDVLLYPVEDLRDGDGIVMFM